MSSISANPEQVQKQEMHPDGSLRSACDRRKTTDQITIYREEYEALKKEHEDFVYRVSHDLSAPIRHIQQFGSILTSSLDGQLNPEQIELDHRINKATNCLQNRLNGLLKISRINTSSLNYELFDAGSISQAVMDKQKYSFPNCDIELNMQTDTLLFGDKHYIGMAIESLLENAIKFRRDDRTLLLSVRTYRDQDRVVLSIEDNGIGIHEDHTESVFEIFRKLNLDEDYAGEGIGLALCRAIACRHEGQISCEQSPTQSTIFKLSLPVE